MEISQGQEEGTLGGEEAADPEYTGDGRGGVPRLYLVGDVTK